MANPGVVLGHDQASAPRRDGAGALPEASPFSARFVELFDGQFRKVFRYLDRLSGEPELAADLTQEAFIRLYRRGSMPDAPEAWLISVALNLFRNARSSESRRRVLLTAARGAHVLSDPPPAPDDAAESRDSRRRVRATLDRMPERERRLLLLRAEGYSYRDIAIALELNEASVGVLLARAKQAFRTSYEEAPHAS